MKVNQILRWAWLLARAWWSYTTRKRCSVCHINKPLTDQDSFVKMFLYSRRLRFASYWAYWPTFFHLDFKLDPPVNANFFKVGWSIKFANQIDHWQYRIQISLWLKLGRGSLELEIAPLLNCSFVLQQNARVGDKFMNQIQPIAARVPYMTCPGNHETA